MSSSGGNARDGFGGRFSMIANALIEGWTNIGISAAVCECIRLSLSEKPCGFTSICRRAGVYLNRWISDLT